VNRSTTSLALLDDRVVGRLGRGGHDQLVEHAALPRAPHDAFEHGAAAELEQHLAGEAGRVHPRLDYAEGCHLVPF